MESVDTISAIDGVIANTTINIVVISGANDGVITLIAINLMDVVCIFCVNGVTSTTAMNIRIVGIAPEGD